MAEAGAVEPFGSGRVETRYIPGCPSPAWTRCCNPARRTACHLQANTWGHS